MCLCYLAGAIDMVDKDMMMNWKEMVSLDLKQYGISIIDPAGTFNMHTYDKVSIEAIEDAKKLREINYYNMMHSDVVLMRFGKEPSIGTPIELEMLTKYDNTEFKNKPIIIWLDGIKKIPFYILSVADRVKITNTLEDAIDTIVAYHEDRYNK